MAAGETNPLTRIFTGIEKELKALWAAHHAVGLKGFMQLYTVANQEPWKGKESSLSLWFGPDDTQAALDFITKHYNGGHLPNSTPLLNPVVHAKKGEEYTPLGSGVIWCTAFTLGISVWKPEAKLRLEGLGLRVGVFNRRDLPNSGIKIVARVSKALPPLPGYPTVEGCKELYEITDIQADEYAPFYVFSGLSYLSSHGSFHHPNLDELFTESGEFGRADLQKVKDASVCWNAYDRHHSLYVKFGIDPSHIDHNLRFYNLCARDVGLFDATGAKHADADTSVAFDFIVDGWLPRGAVTIIGASGGTGKSSLAHNLAVKCAIDYDKGEKRPTWLGSKINFDKAKGICVYFSGEDGPAIVHARAKVYDPKGRAERIMFQRTDFGEGVTISGFLKRLHKLPDIPLVVIDPARKYLTGDENDAGVVSEFFEAIEEFAIQRNAAMLVVHHLVKGAKPTNIADIYDMLRGSQVFIDRARVVIGMYREGQYTVAGLAKNNIPPQLGMVMGERLYTRDAKTLELVPVPGKAGIRGEDRKQDDE